MTGQTGTHRAPIGHFQPSILIGLNFPNGWPMENLMIGHIEHPWDISLKHSDLLRTMACGRVIDAQMGAPWREQIIGHIEHLSVILQSYQLAKS